MQEENENKINQLASTVLKLSNIIVLLVLIIIGLLILLLSDRQKATAEKIIEAPQADSNGLFTKDARAQLAVKTENSNFWHAPDISELKGSSDMEKILYGRNIIAHTAEYYGPQGTVSKASTNGMNCQNCHLDAGTKIFGNNYAAVAATYPKYRARSGSIENVYKRVNDCFERSLNGQAIDSNSKEMQAIVAYVMWLGKDLKKEKMPNGIGLKELAFMNRAADPNSGKQIYIQKCQTCHQANGEGQFNSDKTAYTYPPLWGEHSYNIGAGLYRLSTIARYVKNNMPFGASHYNTQLTDEEAWDVSAFVNTQEHPKRDLKNDWPNLAEKPFDHPFGPYVDGFSETQHKYGPFQPIKDKLNELKKNKKTKV